MKQKTITKKCIDRIIYSNYNCTLYDVYGRYSYAKEKAFKQCELDRLENNGYCARIISYNTFIFTYGYLYTKGNELHYVYITPSKREDYIVIDDNDVIE